MRIRPAAKVAATTIVAVVVLVVSLLSFITYDVVVFQSRRAEISDLSTAASPDERAPSPQLTRLVQASVRGHVSSHVARILIRELSIPQVCKGMLGWHLTSTLWWALVAMHLPENEQVAIFVSRSAMGESRRGMEAEALARFHRTLSSLRLEELATVVAISQAPSIYPSSPEQLGKRRDWLLGQVQDSSNTKTLKGVQRSR